jgi:hypothetical protein
MRTSHAAESAPSEMPHVAWSRHAAKTAQAYQLGSADHSLPASGWLVEAT